MSNKKRNKNEEIEQVVEVTETDVVVEEAPTEESVQELVPSVPLEGVVSGCARLNVRKTPSTDAGVVCVINKNDKVEVGQDDYGDWFQVKIADKQGYCLKEYITIK